MAKPLAIDLYCGLGGWTEGLLTEGWDVIGFDIKRHDYGSGGYPAQLVLMDVCQIHGAMFKDADLIVASPPCQEFSYRAMPWKRAKALPPPLLGTNLFWQCWRIQQEACEAAGRYIPLVVENVKGAQPWVGRAKGRYGSFFLWGDVENIGGRLVRSGPVEFGAQSIRAATRGNKGSNNFHFHEKTGLPSPSFHGAEHEPSVLRAQQIKCGGKHAGRILANVTGTIHERDGSPTKNNGGSWFAVAHNTESGHGQNPDGRQVDLIKFAAERYPKLLEGQKGNGGTWFGDYQAQKADLLNGTKRGGDWFNASQPSLSRLYSSKSSARKAASAQIAKIPFPLSSYIARVFKPARF